ncbi:MAG: hypothetical protein ABII90_15145 [Bacteroidota bacterium]
MEYTLYISGFGDNVYVQILGLYIINHLIITVIRALVRLRSYKYKYYGNTTLLKCIKRRMFKDWTFIDSILATLAEIYLFF